MTKLDEREFVRIFYLRHGVDGKMARFIIDGRRYPDSESVMDAARAARHEPALKGLLLEVDSRKIDPDEQAPNLPGWEEFREQLRARTINHGDSR